MKDIFPEIIAYSGDTYFLYLNFGFDLDCMLQITKADDDLMTVYVHCYEEHPVFLNFVKWFFWIFAISG